MADNEGMTRFGYTPQLGYSVNKSEVQRVHMALRSIAQTARPTVESADRELLNGQPVARYNRRAGVLEVFGTGLEMNSTGEFSENPDEAAYKTVAKLVAGPDHGDICDNLQDWYGVLSIETASGLFADVHDSLVILGNDLHGRSHPTR